MHNESHDSAAPRSYAGWTVVCERKRALTTLGRDQDQQAVAIRAYLVSKGISEDIAQEVAIRALLSPVPIRHPKVWGWRKAVWLKLDSQRREALVPMDTIRPDYRDRLPTPQERAETAERLQRCLNSRVLYLRAYGLSYQEIADYLHIPRGTVMSRLHTARHRLKTSQ